MAKSPTIIGLEELFAPLDNTWINKNSLVINYARNCDLAVGGSIAMAISNKKPHKVPNDFDFFTDKNDNALNFLTKIITWLAQRPKTNYKVLVNNKTKFTLPGVSHHIRILVPFWKPICIMTLESPMRVFHFKGGLQVQYFDDVVAAAKHATGIDNKERLPFDVEAVRADIRSRYITDGTYDVNYQPPVSGVLRTGNNNILVGSFVRTARQEVAEPTSYPNIGEASRPVRARRLGGDTLIADAPYIPLHVTSTQWNSGEVSPEQTYQDLSAVIEHFESHGAVADSMNQRRASNDRIIESARAAVEENQLEYANPYPRSYDRMESVSDSLCEEVATPRNSSSLVANTRRLRTRFSSELAEALQETEIANCNS